MQKPEEQQAGEHAEVAQRGPAAASTQIRAPFHAHRGPTQHITVSRLPRFSSTALELFSRRIEAAIARLAARRRAEAVVIAATAAAGESGILKLPMGMPFRAAIEKAGADHLRFVIHPPEKDLAVSGGSALSPNVVTSGRSSWLCKVLEVARSGLHTWLNRPASIGEIEDAKLFTAIKTSFKASGRTMAPEMSGAMSLRDPRFANAVVPRVEVHHRTINNGLRRPEIKPVSDLRLEGHAPPSS